MHVNGDGSEFVLKFKEQPTCTDKWHCREFLIKLVIGQFDRIPVVLLACGSFSPITYLHLRLFGTLIIDEIWAINTISLSEMARDALEDTDKYQVIGGVLSPVSDAYAKAGLVASHHRISMCEIAVADSDWIVIDHWEATQEDYQTSIKVLHSVKNRIMSQFGNDRRVQVLLLAGADLIKSFSSPGLWDYADREAILRDYGCVVVDRWKSDISEFLLMDPLLYKYRKNIHVVKQFISNDISSTKIRYVHDPALQM